MVTATKPRQKQQQIAEPTRDDVKQAMVWIATHTNLVPTLVGPTASGKTRLVHDWADEIGAECVSVLLSQHTPDEIAGFQTEVKGQLVVQMPYWFRRAEEVVAEGKPAVLLFDELGLAREEVRGALYTFFRDRELHGRTIDGEVYVVAAMNPSVLAPPFRTRSVMLHVPADRSYLLSFAKHSIAKRAAEAGTLVVEGDPAYSNESPPRPETVNAATIDALNRLDTEFWGMTEPAQRIVLQGLVPEATLAEIMQDRLDVSSLARHPEDLSTVLQDAEPVDWLNIVNGVLEALPNCNPAEVADAMIVIQESMYDDVDNRLEPYMAVERPEHIRRAVMGMDNQRFWASVDKEKIVWADDGELRGSMVERWVAQRGEAENE